MIRLLYLHFLEVKLPAFADTWIQGGKLGFEYRDKKNRPDR
jgi:hypothetical protein